MHNFVKFWNSGTQKCMAAFGKPKTLGLVQPNLQDD